MNPDRRFWEGKRVLLTGHTGFKGSWLTIWLRQLGAEVFGISLPPETEPNLYTLAELGNIVEGFFQDIRDAEALASIVRSTRPEVVFHLAAQPLVLASYADPLGTLSTNVMGTANLLNAMRGWDGIRSVVVVTTDKVYDNPGTGHPLRETDLLGGHDPYSASKAASEIVVSSFRDSFLNERGVAIATARAGNVIGGGDWSPDRLIPDAVRAWTAEKPLYVRRPQAVRPWQHVLEPLSGYLRLAEAIWEDATLSGAYNFGPETCEAAAVREVLRVARDSFGRGQIHWGNGTQGVHEAGWLSLEIIKSRNCLGVQPRWGLPESVRRTMDWYRRQGSGSAAMDLCHQNIAAFNSCRIEPKITNGDVGAI